MNFFLWEKMTEDPPSPQVNFTNALHNKSRNHPVRNCAYDAAVPYLSPPSGCAEGRCRCWVLCWVQCCAGRASRLPAGESSRCRGRRSPQSDHRTRRQGTRSRAASARQHAGRGRGRWRRVPGTAAGAPDVRGRTPGRRIWRDQRRRGCPAPDPSTSLANRRVHAGGALRRLLSTHGYRSTRTPPPLEAPVRMFTTDPVAKILATEILLYTSRGAGMLVPTPPARRAASTLPPSDWLLQLWDQPSGRMRLRRRQEPPSH